MESNRLKISLAGAVFAFSGILAPAGAHASLNLKQVQASGSQVDLLFDGKISKSQIKTEFFGDTIQLSLSDTAVYPAKISSVSGGELTKIFAYQYAPKLVRLRLSMKGKAEEFKGRLVLDQKGKILTVRFNGEIDQIASHAAQALRAKEGKSAHAAVATDDDADPGERALLEKILNRPKAEEPPAKTPEPPAAERKAEKSADLQGPPTEALATGKPLVSPVKTMLKMLGVLALFGLFAMGLKKVLAGGVNTKRGGALTRIIQRGMSRYGKSGKMIEVVSTHYLGPKKSIAVVKVGGRNLVLGISQENINLITQLDAATEEFDLDEGSGDLQSSGFLESLGVRGASPQAPISGPSAPSGASRFDVILSGEASKPRKDAAGLQEPTLEAPSVRARIRSRLEGMKPL